VHDYVLYHAIPDAARGKCSAGLLTAADEFGSIANSSAYADNHHEDVPPGDEPNSERESRIVVNQTRHLLGEDNTVCVSGLSRRQS
jgi:hypothetical protein